MHVSTRRASQLWTSDVDMTLADFDMMHTSQREISKNNGDATDDSIHCEVGTCHDAEVFA